MKSKQMFWVPVVMSMVAGISVAQTDFFMSLNDLNTGATNSDLVSELVPGESGSIYIYYSTNGPADSDISTGAFIDILASQPGVIQFTAAETFDFDITFFGSVLGVRWGDSFGAAAAVTDTEVDELGAFAFFVGEGLLEGHNGGSGLLDEGYDAAADAFLFGKIDFTVPVDAAPGTSVDLLMSPGSGMIVNGGAVVPATFGGATFTIGIEEVMGDVNGDGVVSMCDVSPFVQLIIHDEYMSVADINGDGVVNLLDVRPFVKLIQP